MTVWTADDVKARLQEAGATLFALPAHGVWPAGYRIGWPEMVAEVVEAGGWAETIYRLPAPTPEMISRMEETDRWINELVPDALHRRVLRSRSFVNPRTGEAVISWREIAHLTGRDHRGLMRLHERALEALAEKISAMSPMSPLAMV